MCSPGSKVCIASSYHDMPLYQLKTCFSHPEQLRRGVTDEGKDVVERIPAHPTRPAYAHEMNCWWEECAQADAVAWRAKGYSVRVA